MKLGHRGKHGPRETWLRARILLVEIRREEVLGGEHKRRRHHPAEIGIQQNNMIKHEGKPRKGYLKSSAFNHY